MNHKWYGCPTTVSALTDEEIDNHVVCTYSGDGGSNLTSLSSFNLTVINVCNVEDTTLIEPEDWEEVQTIDYLAGAEPITLDFSIIYADNQANKCVNDG